MLLGEDRFTTLSWIQSHYIHTGTLEFKLIAPLYAKFISRSQYLPFSHLTLLNIG